MSLGAYPSLVMDGVLSLASPITTVTLAVVVWEAESVAMTVNLISECVSLSMLLVSNRMRVSLLLRKPKISSISCSRFDVSVVPMATDTVPSVRDKGTPAESIFRH